jgi:hypothetical protein
MVPTVFVLKELTSDHLCSLKLFIYGIRCVNEEYVFITRFLLQINLTQFVITLAV